MAFPSIKSSYAHIWWLGLLCVVQAPKVIILPLPLGAGVMCCPQLTFKPSLGRREKLPQKVGRREIYRPVPPPSNKDHQRVDNIFKCTSHFIFDFNLFIFNLNQLHLTNNSHYKKCAPHPRPKSLPVVLTYIVLFSLLNGITAKCSTLFDFWDTSHLICFFLQRITGAYFQAFARSTSQDKSFHLPPAPFAEPNMFPHFSFPPALFGSPLPQAV